ncbi:hypothetical protein J2X54_002924 [Duganella sp. 3397]|nr:hypothetical protein [Duganella sp. 3397]
MSSYNHKSCEARKNKWLLKGSHQMIKSLREAFFYAACFILGRASNSAIRLITAAPLR